jgi:hypothetical protein
MPYDVRTADLNTNRADILRLWNGSLRDADAKRYQWIYERNPQGAVGCWLVNDAGGAAAGVAAAFPQTIHGSRRLWRAGVAGDFVVDKAHRAIGPALMLQKALAKSCAHDAQFDVVYGFANQAARAVQVRAGFKDLGPATDLRKVIRTEAALVRRYGTAGRVAAPMVDAAIALMDRRSRPSTHELRCVDVAAFDTRFDDLWARVAPLLPFTGERSSRYLTWRFRENPHIRYQTLAAERTDIEALAGYLVWYVRANELIVADVIADPSSDALEVLVAQVLKHARHRGVQSVRLRYFGAPERLQPLHRLGFRESESGRYVVMSVSPAASSQVPLDRNSWYLLEADADP